MDDLPAELPPDARREDLPEVDAMSSLRRGVRELARETSEELEAQRRGSRVGWGVLVAITLGGPGVNLLLLGLTIRASFAGVLAGLGASILVAVATVIAFLLRASLRHETKGRDGGFAPEQDRDPTQLLAQVVDELARVRTEAVRIRSHASDTILLWALIFPASVAYASYLFPSLVLPAFGASIDPNVLRVVLSAVVGTLVIVCAIWFWRATLSRAGRFEARSRLFVEGVARIEQELWRRYA